MKILIVTNHFRPENFRINDLAAGLHERGHQVTVFTAIPDYPQGKFYPGYGFFKRTSEVLDGILIKRFPIIPRGSGRAWNLLLNYASSALFSCLYIPFVCREKYDVIFVFETSPVSIGLPALLLRRLKGIPVVFWVLDLWPESLSATGAVNSPWVQRVVCGFVRSIYRRCDRILVSSKAFAGNIRASGSYKAEIQYFPNWVEPEYQQVNAVAKVESLPQLPEGFRILFAGNIGAAQDFGTILAAAEFLKEKVDIHWIILGHGRMADWVKEQVELRGLGKQFHLLGQFPASTMPAFFRRADATLLTLRNAPIFALTAPGKLQSYMTSGRPVICAIEGEGARIISEAGAGVCCPASNGRLLADKVLELYGMTEEERLTMGENGIRYCKQHFDRDTLFSSLEQTIQDVVVKNQEEL